MISKHIRIKANSYLGEGRFIIMGFGREGRSTFNFLKKYFPEKELLILDANTQLEEELRAIGISYALKEDFFAELESGDTIFKSPGISLKGKNFPKQLRWISQTDLFLYLFGSQSIGITATKGKTTTVHLVYHILKELGRKVILMGNMGIPVLEMVDQMDEKTIAVIELSSHQLQYVNHAPHWAALLNIFPEHLDHYEDYQSYRDAKWNIAKHQSKSDFIACNAHDSSLLKEFNQNEISSQVRWIGSQGDVFYNETSMQIEGLGKSIKLDTQKYQLKGEHNIYNLMITLQMVYWQDIDPEIALQVAYRFKALPHRMEYVGVYKGIHFVNDSIATIPQATIQALKAYPEVATLILGGFNRGLNYQILVDYLCQNPNYNIIFLGEVGHKLFDALQKEAYKGKCFMAQSMKEVVDIAFRITPKGMYCLLSPAASSYDMYKNFEHRGDDFKRFVQDQ